MMFTRRYKDMTLIKIINQESKKGPWGGDPQKWEQPDTSDMKEKWGKNEEIDFNW